MKKFIKLFTALFLVLSLQINAVSAQTIYHGSHAAKMIEGANMVRVKGDEQFLTYLLYAEDKQPSVVDYIGLFKSQYGIDNAYTFELIDHQLDHLGQEHFRYQQFYKGIPIRTAHLGLHTKEGKVLSVSGFFYKEPFAIDQVSIAEEEALKKALEVVPATTYKWELPEEEEFIKIDTENSRATFYPKGELYYIGEQLKDETEKQRLCFRFDIYAHEPVARQHVYVDAVNGEIIFKESIIKHANTPATANTAYSGVQNIVTDSVAPNVFRLRESTRGNGVETYNLNRGSVYANATDFIDSTNSWTTFNPTIDQYAADAHWGAEMTYDYFFQKHNRNSINNNGFTLKSYIHYKTNYVNAFWDGQRMTYGDGDNTTSPLTTLDITGHEVTHGLTRFTSNLIYANESGALNESFSDIFGFAVEKFSRAGNWNWTIGEDIGRAFRNLSNPKQFGDPDTYGGINWISQKNCIPDNTNDKCGVHTNSGVQNHWFYLLSEGGIGLNDLGDSINVVGLGTDSAAAIAFRTNTLYLTPSSNYEDARFFSFRSAVDLYGACSPAVASTINAWHAVGVGDKYVPGLSVDFFAENDTLFCANPAVVKFASQGNNIYDFKWDFGDGDSSELPEPTHSYASPGIYTVTLHADGLACGKDTVVRNNYIRINSSFQCSLSLDSSSTTTTECQGRFYDSGGLNGTYRNNHSDTLYIQPTTADQILFEFTHFDVEAGEAGFCNRDYVEIFDGSTIDAPSLGRFCNSVLPPDSILSTTSALTVVFYADRYVANRGFGAKWECIQATASPLVDFKTSVDTTCDGNVKFFNRSLNGADTFHWDFGDGITSNLKDPEHKYKSNGNYTVKLVAQNSFGKDSLIKSAAVHVARPLVPAIKDDTVCLNGRLKLGLETANSYKWYYTKEDERHFHIGDTLVLNKPDTTRSFYVESFIDYPKKNLVPLNMAGNSYYSDSTAALYFDVETPLLLRSVVLYSNVARNRTIEVKNAEGIIIHSKSVYVRASSMQVSLDFVLYPDTAYSIYVADRDPALRINSSGASYPYKENGIISINRSNLGGDAFPFFYYWDVKPLSCVSEREKITAFVDTSCVVTALAQLNKEEDKLTVYPNPFSSQFKVELPKVEKAYTIYLYDTNGRLIAEEKSIGNHQQHTIKTEGLSNGVYFLKIEGEQRTYQQKLIKYNGK